MPEVVSMASAWIPPERADEVIAEFRAAVRRGNARTPAHIPLPRRARPDANRHGLAHREDLNRYLASVDRPFARRILEDAGGETIVDVLEFVMDSNTTWWT